MPWACDDDNNICMDYKYSIFETDWGYFGLFGTDKGVLRSCLAAKSISLVKDVLLADIDETNITKGTFGVIEMLVKNYYKGIYVDFSQVPVMFDGFTDFTEDILTACSKITYGQTVSYGQLASLAGRDRASRAVGTALGKNRIPLIIPCHRIIQSNGNTGGFSAPGGTKTKQKMLNLEAKRMLTK